MRVPAFLFLVKMHTLFNACTLVCVIDFCLATVGVVHFSCVASAAHFLFSGGKRNEKDY